MKNIVTFTRANKIRQGEKRKSIFDHIPKTGGTSIRIAFERATGCCNGLNKDSYPHHIAVSHTMSRFLAAHLWFYSGEKLSGEFYYATVLRDPVDRFLSQYYYSRQIVTKSSAAIVSDYVLKASVELSLDRYISCPNDEVRRSYSNLQARHYAARVSEHPEDLSDSALLDAAITSLEDYDLVGAYDEIQTFFARYCVSMGAEPQPLPTLNATLERSSVSDIPTIVRDKLVAANSVDLALVRWVHRRSTRAGASVLMRLRRALRRTREPQPADFGTRELEIVSASVKGESNLASAIFGGEMVEVLLTCCAHICEPNLTIGIAIRNYSGEPHIQFNSKQLNYHIAIETPGAFSATIRFVAPEEPGDYNITIALHQGLTHLDRCYHWRDRCVNFTVCQNEQFLGRSTGNASIRVSSLQLPVRCQP